MFLRWPLTAGTDLGNATGRQAVTSGAELVVTGTPVERNNFILDGVSDNTEFDEALSGAKATVEFEAIDHYHHGPQPGDIPDPSYAVTDQRMHDFFDQHQKHA
jgi:hypothetical protein